MFFWNSLAFLWSNECWQFDLWFLCLFYIQLEHLQVHVLLKPGLENFEHYFASVWDECQLCGSLNILWHCPSLGLEWKLTFFQSCGHCWVFQICWHVECSTFTASSFRIWNSSTGIPSPPLALFLVMLPQGHLTSHSRMSGSRWVITPLGYLGREDLFCIVLLCILATS